MTAPPRAASTGSASADHLLTNSVVLLTYSIIVLTNSVIVMTESIIALTNSVQAPGQGCKEGVGAT